jgi:rod shape-determining protein MreD
MLFNNQQNLNGYFVSLVLAMGMNIGLFPLFLKSINPDWVLLIIIYWTLAIPEKLGVFNAWIVGLLIDVLTGRLLGQHALAYALISYACLKLHKRLRLYPIPRQALFIFCCLFFSQILVFWIEDIQSPTKFELVFWLPAFTGTLMWPVVFFILRFFRTLARTG